VSRRAGRRALVGALALVAAVGCGGRKSPSLTRLRAQATSIWSSATVRAHRIATPAWKAGAGGFLQNGINVLSPELGRLERLAAPSSDADVYTSALNAVSAELTALRSAVTVLKLGENPVLAYKALQHRLTPLEAQANDAWGALQIPACAG